MLPMFHKIDLMSKEAQVLIILPTRELAGQINQVLSTYKMSGLRQSLLIGGASKERQKEKMRQKPHVVMGTPGRIAENWEEKRLKLEGIHTVIVDEADKLSDEKFYYGVRDLLLQVPKEAQIMFFSATLTKEAQRMMQDLKRDFRLIAMSKKKTNEDIHHLFTMAEDAKKFPLLITLSQRENIKRAIVFITRNAGVKGLAGRMQEAGLSTEGIHSGLSSQERKKIIGYFRTGKVDFLVTTDIFARGMDVPDVDYIINYDLPKDQSIYIHRSGRTARAGRKGTVITFVEEHKKFVIRKFEQALDITIHEKGYTKDGQWVDVIY